MMWANKPGPGRPLARPSTGFVADTIAGPSGRTVALAAAVAAGSVSTGAVAALSVIADGTPAGTVASGSLLAGSTVASSARGSRSGTVPVRSAAVRAQDGQRYLCSQCC